ncbi:MAG: deoxyribose-phosphate aldolase [Clostridia bacterium]|nr:deoxyribose-phosphate aldolase [Clostridia bacterium]
MDIKQLLSRVDHTLLKVDATWAQIKQICDDGVCYGTASVCIPASFVKRCSDYSEGRVKICTVVGFPNGYSTPAAKAFEAREAVGNGADEVDMVINIGALKEGNYPFLEEEIRLVKSACGDKILKVIIETCLLSDEEKIKMCEICGKAGADYIKTSTGFSTGGATLADVKLFAANVPAGLKIKAAGGISCIEDAVAFVEAGADRLGTSRLVSIAKEMEKGV